MGRSAFTGAQAGFIPNKAALGGPKVDQIPLRAGLQAASARGRRYRPELDGRKAAAGLKPWP